MIIKTALLAGLLAASGSAFAATDFTGTAVTATLLYPNTATVYAGPATATVGAGVEFPGGAFAPANGSIDVGAHGFTYFTNASGQYSTAPFNGYRLDFAKRIAVVTLDPASTLTPVDYSFSGKSVFFNVSGRSFNSGQSTTFDVAAVPEAATWAMMVAGFGLVGASVRRRRGSIVAA